MMSFKLQIEFVRKLAADLFSNWNLERSSDVSSEVNMKKCLALYIFQLHLI